MLIFLNGYLYFFYRNSGGGSRLSPYRGGGRLLLPYRGGGRPISPFWGGRPLSPFRGGGRPLSLFRGGGRPLSPYRGGGRRLSSYRGGRRGGGRAADLAGMSGWHPPYTFLYFTESNWAHKQILKDWRQFLSAETQSGGAERDILLAILIWKAQRRCFQSDES